MERVERLARHVAQPVTPRQLPRRRPATSPAPVAAMAPDDAALQLAVHPLWMELDVGALKSNVAVLRQLAGPDQLIIASTKANAYGHGAAPVATALEAAGVDGIWTGSFAEAAAARAAGVRMPILMFGACVCPFECSFPRRIASCVL